MKTIVLSIYSLHLVFYATNFFLDATPIYHIKVLFSSWNRKKKKKTNSERKQNKNKDN